MRAPAATTAVEMPLSSERSAETCSVGAGEQSIKMGHVRVLELFGIHEQSLCSLSVVAIRAKMLDHLALVPHVRFILPDVPPHHLQFRSSHAPAYTKLRAFDRGCVAPTPSLER